MSVGGIIPYLSMTEARVKGLDGIRALCALFLLWGHMAQKDFTSWGLSLLPLPECSAYVFFVISGFLVGFRMDVLSSPKAYYRKKAKRILPLYYSYILLTSLVFLGIGRGEEVFNLRILYYVLLVPAIPFAASKGILPLVHLWFIGTLVLFYLVVPLFAKVKEEKQCLFASIIAVSWFIIKLLLRINGGGYFYRLVGCTCFDVLFIGVWGGLIMRKGFSHFDDSTKFVLSIIAWVLFLFSGFYGRYVPAPVRTEFVAVLSLIIIVTQQRQNPSIILENRIARFLGGVSYEIYVGHILLIILLSMLYVYWGLCTSAWLVYVVTTVAVVLFAFVFKVSLAFVLSPKNKRQ